MWWHGRNYDFAEISPKHQQTPMIQKWGHQTEEWMKIKLLILLTLSITKKSGPFRLSSNHKSTWLKSNFCRFIAKDLKKITGERTKIIEQIREEIKVIYPLMKTLRSDEHDLGSVPNLHRAQTRGVGKNFSWNRKESKRNSKRGNPKQIPVQAVRVWDSVPLQMSLWPRGRTLVSGWRRSFSSAVEADVGSSTGMVRPANFTWTVIVGGELSMACFSTVRSSEGNWTTPFRLLDSE